MNEILARRYSQRMSFNQLNRSIPLMWSATSLTKEKLDVRFLKEELMRVNGQRSMPLLLGDAAAFDCQNNHLNQLTDACAWAESAQAMAVRHQSPMTSRIAAMGRMNTNIQQSKTALTMQTAFSEQISRLEGICKHDPEPEDE